METKCLKLKMKEIPLPAIKTVKQSDQSRTPSVVNIKTRNIPLPTHGGKKPVIITK